MDPRRSERVAEALREELDELISYEMDDPRVGAASVAEVHISSDARAVHVRLMLGGSADEQRQALEAINGAKGWLRREIAARLDLCRVPDLHFEAAVSAELGARAAQLLKRVRKGRPRPE